MLTGEQNCNRSLVVAFTNISQIVRIDLEVGSLSALTPSTGLANPIAITSDQENGVVFFTDVLQRRIYRKDVKTNRDAYVIRNLEPGNHQYES